MARRVLKNTPSREFLIQALVAGDLEEAKRTQDYLEMMLRVGFVGYNKYTMLELTVEYNTRRIACCQ